MDSSRYLRATAAIAALALVAACGEVTAPDAASSDGLLTTSFTKIFDYDVPPPQDPKVNTVTVCKVGSDATFTIDSITPAGGSFDVAIADGTCEDVFVAVPDGVTDEQYVDIYEQLEAGQTIDSIQIYSVGTGSQGPTGSFRDTIFFQEATVIPGVNPKRAETFATKFGCLLVYYNSTVCTGEIGDFVWNDSGGTKGIQDAGEVGLAGVTVNLYDGAMNLIATTTTDANGFYLFTGLCAGDYEVEVDETTVPAGWMQTPTGVGADPTIDNNPNPSMVNLPTNDASDLTIDFGYMEPPGGGEGCTPGYYKNLRKHLFAWTAAGYDPNQSVASVFSEAANAPYAHLGAATLHEGLSFQGGDSVEEKAEILLRAAIAAVLNAANPNVDYAYSAGQIIADVNAALASQDPYAILDLASDLDRENNAGCPLGNRP